MRSTTYELSIPAVRADALFASALQQSDEPTAAQVDQAVAAAIRAHGTRGCAARVAQEYGEHPETAAIRMRWARATAGGAVGGTRTQSARCPVPGQRTARGTCRAA
jgi:hypothetical protein